MLVELLPGLGAFTEPDLLCHPAGEEALLAPPGRRIDALVELLQPVAMRILEARR